jgi:hypothetical protein
MHRRAIVIGVGLLLIIVSALAVWAYCADGVTPVSRDATRAEAPVAYPPSISAAVSAIPPTLESPTGQPQTREDPPKAMMSIAELSAEDRTRLSQVDEILSEAGRAPIPSSSRIAVDDLEVFRTVVDKNRAAVSAAKATLTRRADTLLADRRQQVVDRIAAGIIDGLPIKGPNNRLRRRHPYEAITEQEIAGKRYVIRVHPSEDAQLAKAGEDYGNELNRQLFDCDSLLRGLLVSSR